MGNFKVYTTSNKRLCRTAPSAWKCPKTQSWGPLTNWKFEPSPRPHTHSDPIINKHAEQIKKLRSYCFIMTCIELCVIGQKLSITLKRGFGYLGFQKKFKTHPPKLAEVEPSFRKVSLLPAKLRMLFPAHPWVREFWPQIYSLSQTLNWGLLSKILASTKMGGT